MTGYGRALTSKAEHFWAASERGVECAWCGMRPHWQGSRQPCTAPTGGRLVCARERVERPEVEVVSQLEGERVVRW